MSIATTAPASHRLTAIDALRGAVIVLMTLDHVRDFFLRDGSHLDLSDPNLPLSWYVTRWITHYCAPLFVALAGVSAGLMATRKTPGALGLFLLTRGTWLIAIEWFVISIAWTFAPFGMPEADGAIMVTLGVIWAIGASMVVLAVAQLLGRRFCLLLGLLIVLGHNALDGVWPSPESFDPATPPLWVGLHTRTWFEIGPYFVNSAYPLLPWTGVMLLGFGAASWFERPAPERNRRLLQFGLVAIALFIAMRAIDAYGDPNHWQRQINLLRTTMDFLDTSKYPPSLLFVLMTLGPGALACVALDRVRGVVATVLLTFGRVPFAFYVTHLFLIHAGALLLGMAQGFPASAFLTSYGLFPDGYGAPLAGVYVVWIAVLLMLFPFCRWMAALKARRNDWWLSYL